MSKENEKQTDEIMTEAEEQKYREQAQDEVFGSSDSTTTPKEEVLENKEEKEVEEKENSTQLESTDDDVNSLESKKENVVLPKEDSLDKILKSIQVLNSTVSGMEGRLRQNESRVGNLTHEYKTAKKVAEETKASPTNEQMQEAAKTAGGWEDLKTNFPDWATAIESKINETNQDFISKNDFDQFKDSILKNDTSNNTTVTKEELKELELKLIDVLHPNWQETVNSQDFISWVQTQPIDIINKVNHSEDARDAINVLNTYKDQKQEIVNVQDIITSQDKRLKSSVITNKKHQTIKPKAESDMSEAELREKIQAEVFGGK